MTRSELTALSQSHGCKLVPASDYTQKPNDITINRHDIKNAVKITPGEFDRCGTYITEDLQSGPIYCGEWATNATQFLKDGDTVTVAWCQRHTPREHR